MPELDPAQPSDAAVELAAWRAAATPGLLAAACRAVLQELRVALPCSWAAVLALRAGRAEVLAVYPAPLAGIDAGLGWEPLDAADVLLARSGEPSLAGELRHVPGDSSPLTRLPSYGIHSVLRVPLFDDGAVVGVVLLCAEASQAFTARDGLALERYARALGPRLAAEPAPAAPPAPAPPVPEAAPAPAPALPPPRTAAAEAEERGAELSLAALGDFVTGVAHELNNPLTTILGYAQLLSSLPAPEQERAAETIAREAQRAGRVLRRLLAFGRQEPPRAEAVDLAAVLARVAEVRRVPLAATGVRLELALRPLPAVRGDQYQLEQVFLNLVANAQQALQPRGGTVRIASALAGERVRVSVEDDGPGIAPEQRTRVFEPFFTTRGGEAAGLGLATAYGIVRAHGGAIRVEAGAGGGARFVVELPLPDEAPLAAAPAPEAERGSGERVLDVDGDAAVRALVAEILGAAGYATLGAASLHEATGQLAGGSFELVVAAARLPDGAAAVLAEVAAAASAGAARPPRLLLIGGDAAAARAAGAGWFPRPFTAAELRAAVREALRAR